MDDRGNSLIGLAGQLLDIGIQTVVDVQSGSHAYAPCIMMYPLFVWGRSQESQGRSAHGVEALAAPCRYATGLHGVGPEKVPVSDLAHRALTRYGTRLLLTPASCLNSMLGLIPNEKKCPRLGFPSGRKSWAVPKRERQGEALTPGYMGRRAPCRRCREARNTPANGAGRDSRAGLWRQWHKASRFAQAHRSIQGFAG